MDDPWKRPTFGPSVFYQDPKPMLGWLERAFGFSTTMVITDDSGLVVHAEMGFGDGYIMVGGHWADWARSPAAVGGVNTQSLHVHLTEDLDAHCERARAAGARIVQEPADQFYGDRTYRAADTEGHNWTFAHTVRRVSREEAEQATGLTIDGWPQV